MEKYLFPAFCFLTAIAFTAITLIYLFIDEEWFFLATSAISATSTSLMLVLFGMATFPKRNKEEK